MQIVEFLTDAEIAEAYRSKSVFDEVLEMTAPLDALLSLIHAFDWLDLKSKEDKAALQEFMTGQFGDPVLLAMGRIEPELWRENGPKDKASLMKRQKPAEEIFERFLEIYEKAQALVQEERFLNWQVAFPGVWSNWENDALTGGFDAVIGNPPWDRMKLQQVEWFAARKREIAHAQRAADRTRMIHALEQADDPLADDFAKASQRAETSVRVARHCGDFRLLSSGDVNLYSLFVERAMTLAKPKGMVGLLTPSGISSDKTAAAFFKGVATSGRLKALYDFENRRTRYALPPFFPDVDTRFKFLAFIASPTPVNSEARCAFFLQAVSELNDPERCFPLSPEDFARVNPNTGTAPIFRSRRDARLTSEIYQRVRVLVDRTGDIEVKAWPVRYFTMFHMTNDSHLFLTKKELEEKEGAYPTRHNCFKNAKGEFLPLYEGKMVQAYDHRAASIVVNLENQHRPAQPEPATPPQHESPDWLPEPQFWINKDRLPVPDYLYALAFKDVTAPTNIRSMIAAIIPRAGVGNTLPILLAEPEEKPIAAETASLYVSNFNSMIFDFVARQKIQGQHLNWYIVEQLPVVPRNKVQAMCFGKKGATDVIRDAVLELTYTAHDMAPFARDMGYVTKAGKVKPPFKWDVDRRLKLRAKLDAVYFHLYGVTDRDDVQYIYSTFPIVEREEMELYGSYRSRDLCLAYMNALAAGDADAEIDL